MFLCCSQRAILLPIKIIFFRFNLFHTANIKRKQKLPICTRSINSHNLGCLKAVLQILCFGSPVPEFIDPVFTKTSQKRSFSLNRKRAFQLVFAKTGSIISGTGFRSVIICTDADPDLDPSINKQKSKKYLDFFYM